MVAWCMLPSGNEVVVTFDTDDGEVWRDFQKKAYGVAALQALPVALKSGGRVPSLQEAAETTVSTTQGRRHLSLPEAYYAAAIDEVLPVNGSLQDLWEKFSGSNPRFPRQFAVYHHFCRLGWILQSGLNYGAHYVLYRGAAANFHSEYIVYVQDNDEPLSWHTTQSLTRIAADVKKTVLLCTVDIAQVSAVSSTTSAGYSVANHQTIGAETDLTFGTYRLHDTEYTIEAVAVRFWDASTVDGQSYSFQPQPMLLKKGKKLKKKDKVKRPKRQVKGEALAVPESSSLNRS